MNPISIILLLIAIVWIIIDFIFRDDLFQSNHQLALWLQNKETSPHSAHFIIFRIISILGYQEALGPLMVIGYLFFANKIQGFKVILATLFSSYILSVLKMIYHEPRPYFVFSDLQGIGCDGEFGKPSGHAMVSVVIYYLLFDAFINRKYSRIEKMPIRQQELTDFIVIQNIQIETTPLKEKQPKLNLKLYDISPERFLNNFLFLGLYLATIFSIGFSRIILGVHSFGQILLGWSYGIIFIIVYREKGDKILENILTTITLKQFNTYRSLRNYALKLTAIYIVLVIFAVSVYVGVDYSISDETKQKYVHNYHSKPYCKAVNINSLDILTKKCLIDSAVISIFFSVLLTTIFSNGLYQPELWRIKYSQISIIKKILRILVQVGCPFIPVGASLFFILDHVYLTYFFKASYIYFVGGFFLIKVSPWVLRVLKLDIDGDFLKSQPEYGFFEPIKARFFDPLRQK